MTRKTRNQSRREAFDESAIRNQDPPQRGRGRGRGRGRLGGVAGRRGLEAEAATVEVPRRRRGDPGMADFTAGLQGLQQVVQQLVGVVVGQQQVNQGQENQEYHPQIIQGEQPVNATASRIQVSLADFMKLKPPTFSGSNATEDPQRFIDSLERLWRSLGCSDIRAVELASFQLEGAAYDWFDTVSRGRPAESPPLAWGEFSQLFMARFLPESVRDELAYEFERFEQTESMSVSEYSARFTQLSRYAPYPVTEEVRVKRFIKGLKEYLFSSVVGSKCSTFTEVLSLTLQLEQRQKEKRGITQDSRKKQRVEGSYSNFPSYGSGHIPNSQGQQRPVSHRGGSSGQSSGTIQSRRSDHWGSSHSTYPQRHTIDTSTPCSACGKFHAGTCLGNDRVCYQCGQTGHIRRNCPAAVKQPSSSHASAPAGLASSQSPSTAVRPVGSSYGQGFGASQRGGRGFGGRGQMQAGRGQARVFALTRQDAEASNAVVTDSQAAE